MFSCKQLTGDLITCLMLSILRKLVFSLFFIPRVEKVRLESMSPGFLVCILHGFVNSWLQKRLHGHHVLILPQLVNSWMQKRLQCRHVLILPRLVNSWLQKSYMVAMFLFGEQLSERTTEKLHGGHVLIWRTRHVLILPQLVNSWLQKSYMVAMFLFYLDWWTAVCSKVTCSPCSYFTSTWEQLISKRFHVSPCSYFTLIGEHLILEKMSWLDGFHVLSYTWMG